MQNVQNFKHVMLYIIITILILVVLILVGYILIPLVNTKAGNRDYNNIDLTWVRSSPNCVSSKVDFESSYYIEPFTANDLQDVVFNFAQIAPIKIVYKSSSYIHFSIISPIMHYVDDVELLQEGDRIHIRSCSRIGYSDNGLNRSRIERVKELMSHYKTI